MIALRWLATDSLAQRVLKKDGQMQILSVLGYKTRHYFIEHYTYTDIGDFLYPHGMITWVISENSRVYNMESVEPLKKKK